MELQKTEEQKDDILKGVPEQMQQSQKITFNYRLGITTLEITVGDDESKIRVLRVLRQCMSDIEKTMKGK